MLLEERNIGTIEVVLLIVIVHPLSSPMAAVDILLRVGCAKGHGDKTRVLLEVLDGEESGRKMIDQGTPRCIAICVNSSGE